MSVWERSCVCCDRSLTHIPCWTLWRSSLLLASLYPRSKVSQCWEDASYEWIHENKCFSWFFFQKEMLGYSIYYLSNTEPNIITFMKEDLLKDFCIFLTTTKTWTHALVVIFQASTMSPVTRQTKRTLRKQLKPLQLLLAASKYLAHVLLCHF